MGKAIVRGLVFAVVGAVVGCAAAWWAATQWTSFSDHWLFAPSILPPAGLLIGAWIATPKEQWPPANATRLLLGVIGGVLGGLAGYVAFALVSTTWHGTEVGGLAGFIGLLLDPGRIPELSSHRGSGPAISQGALFRLGVGCVLGLAAPFFLIAKPKKQ